MLSTRQSSEPTTSPVVSSSCRHFGGCLVASRTVPFQLLTKAFGGENRNAPKGFSAYGMPRNWAKYFWPEYEGCREPRTSPVYNLLSEMFHELILGVTVFSSNDRPAFSVDFRWGIRAFWSISWQRQQIHQQECYEHLSDEHREYRFRNHFSDWRRLVMWQGYLFHAAFLWLPWSSFSITIHASWIPIWLATSK